MQEKARMRVKPKEARTPGNTLKNSQAGLQKDDGDGADDEERKDESASKGRKAPSTAATETEGGCQRVMVVEKESFEQVNPSKGPRARGKYWWWGDGILRPSIT